MVRGLEDASISMDIINQCFIQDNLRDLTLKELQKLVEAKENSKRNMAEFGRNYEDRL